jgi:hypothetical protein
MILTLNLAALEMGDRVPSRRVDSRVSPALLAALREQRALRETLLQEPGPGALPSGPGPGAGLWWDRRIGAPSMVGDRIGALC